MDIILLPCKVKSKQKTFLKEILTNTPGVNYNLVMLINILVGFAGAILFLFVFWKRLKEDYSSNIIFNSGMSILLGIALGTVFAKLIAPEWFFWTSFLGSLLGMFLMILKFKLKFYETFESLVLAGIPLISLVFFKDSIISSSLHSFLAFVASLVLIFLAFWLDVNYKNFTWYKSGKIGFAGLFSGIIFFLARTIVAILGISMISFVGKTDIVLSGISTLIFIGLLINLGRLKK